MKSFPPGARENPVANPLVQIHSNLQEKDGKILCIRRESWGTFRCFRCVCGGVPLVLLSQRKWVVFIMVEQVLTFIHLVFVCFRR